MSCFHISAKNLASLVLDRFCPACFYLLLHRTADFPFLFPPSRIFYLLEDLQRSTIAALFERDGGPPDWFGPFSDVTSMLGKVGKIRFVDKKFELVGIPDEFFGYDDGSICIADYKTAFSNGKAAGLYAAQVNAYAYLAERQEDPFTVTSGALFYFEATPDEDSEAQLSRATESGLVVPFNLAPVEVKLEHNKLIPELLGDARAIWASSTAPTGKAGCPDCERLQALLDLLKAARMTTETALAIDRKAHQLRAIDRDYEILKSFLGGRCKTAASVTEVTDGNFDDTVVANWDPTEEE